MVEPVIHEVSGVDHPAHRTEGWLALQKADSLDISPEMAELLDTAREANNTPVNKGITMPTETDTGEVTDEEFTKAISGLPESIRKAMEADRVRTRNAEAIAKSLLNERQEARFEAMAKELMHLPGVEATEFAKDLRGVSEATGPETFEKLLKVLRGADDAIAKGAAFSEIGASGNGDYAGSAGASIEAFAKELEAKDPTLSHADAVVQAATDHPELYTTHRTETLRQNAEV
jgi:hypothetical protein